MKICPFVSALKSEISKIWTSDKSLIGTNILTGSCMVSGKLSNFDVTTWLNNKKLYEFDEEIFKTFCWCPSHISCDEYRRAVLMLKSGQPHKCPFYDCENGCRLSQKLIERVDMNENICEKVLIESHGKCSEGHHTNSYGWNYLFYCSFFSFWYWTEKTGSKEDLVKNWDENHKQAKDLLTKENKK